MLLPMVMVRRLFLSMTIVFAAFYTVYIMTGKQELPDLQPEAMPSNYLDDENLDTAGAEYENVVFRAEDDHVVTGEARSLGEGLSKTAHSVVNLNGSENTGLKNNSERVQTATKLNYSGRYLLFLNAVGFGGPNCQFVLFRNALMFAMMDNRSLAAAVHFHSHAVYDKVKRERTLQETFDVTRLTEIVNIESVERFKEECNSTVEALLTSASPGNNTIVRPRSLYQKSAASYQDMYGIRVPSQEDAIKLKTQTRRKLETASTLKCVGIWVLRPSDFGLKSQDLRKTVLNHMRYSADIQKAAEDIGRLSLHSQPYITLHWRNMAQELYTSCIKRRKGNCESHKKEADAMKRTSIVVAERIRNLMNAHKLLQIYVALPPMHATIVQTLQNVGITDIITASNITDELYPDLASRKYDNYFWSLVEEQICINSHIFIGFAGSTWSSAVDHGRGAVGKKSLFVRDIVKSSMKTPGAISGFSHY
ncbi:uncharacterized protein [Ptychodera flava]|uniref:uncharacterized protein isoform X2 n=1 Tax=Ptychodera flava TaxID=63121 RepID=UPI00396A2377